MVEIRRRWAGVGGLAAMRDACRKRWVAAIVSVTMAALHFTVSLIPTTMALTTLGGKQAGEPVKACSGRSALPTITEQCCLRPDRASCSPAQRVSCPRMAPLG